MPNCPVTNRHGGSLQALIAQTASPFDQLWAPILTQNAQDNTRSPTVYPATPRTPPAHFVRDTSTSAALAAPEAAPGIRSSSPPDPQSSTPRTLPAAPQPCEPLP